MPEVEGGQGAEMRTVD